jgi:hypothetical protein
LNSSLLHEGQIKWDGSSSPVTEERFGEEELHGELQIPLRSEARLLDVVVGRELEIDGKLPSDSYQPAQTSADGDGPLVVGLPVCGDDGNGG